MLLSQQFAMAAQRASNQPAIHYLGKDIRFQELGRKIAQLSYLYQNELGQGARVAMLASNCPAVIATFFALSNTRSVVVPIDPERSFEEIGKWLRESEATHLAISSDRTSMARDLLRAERLALPVIEIEKKMGGEYDGSFTPLPESPPKDTDVILLLRTAGVSEPSRFVAFDHNRLQQAVAAIRGVSRATGNDRFLTQLNWFHPFAFIHGMLFPLLNGSVCVVDHGVEKKDLAKFLREAKVTRLVASAEHARQALQYWRESGIRSSTLKAMIVGLAGVTPELEELGTATGVPLVRCYGQTENGWTVAMDDFSELGQNPRPWPKGLSGLRYKVLDANGDEREGKDERTGPLAVSGGTVMIGYRGPEKEKKELEKASKQKIRGTWLYTGDVATIQEDEEGAMRVKVLGRREQLLEVGSAFISPEAIDAAVRKIPGVLDGAGFITHDFSQKPVLACAFVREEGRTLRPQDVLYHLRSLLPSEQLPLSVALAESIPRTLAGVNRPRLGLQFSGIPPTEVLTEAPAPQAPAEPALPGSELLAETLSESPLEASSPPAAALPPVQQLEVQSEPPAQPQSRPRAKSPTVHYRTLDLDWIIPGEALPANLYLYLESRFVVYVPKGVAMSRASYDRLQFNGITQLFAQDQDFPALSAWSAQHGRGGLVAPELVAGAESAPVLFREKIREHAFALFQSPRDGERVTKTLEVSRALLTEVISAPYAVRPLAQLQALAGGTVDHSINVSMLSVYLALQMGYSHQLILQHVGAGALLHDFGKCLVKTLEGDTPEQVEQKMREHPTLGAQALEKEKNTPKEVLMIVAQHHECHDGSGYPKGLHGAVIYDLSRIVSIANVFDDLVTHGSGDLRARQAMALKRLEQEMSSKFDPQKLTKALRILSLGL